MKTYDVAIVGAGIVGLATAKALREQHPKISIAVIENEPSVGSHQTGHNSGVIHSGVYYKPGSQKALNCRRGYELLLEFLKSNDLAFDLCGKLIVATRPEQVPQLTLLKQRGEANGLSGLKVLSRSEAKEIEPFVNAEAALLVPQAGIVDYKLVANQMFQNLQKSVDFFLGHRVVDIKPSLSRVSITCLDMEMRAGVLINCAGLYSDAVADLVLSELNTRILPFRGEYYLLKPEAEKYVRNLIYPVPDSRFPFLGVHFTRMIGGGVEAGPNAALAMAKEGYSWRDVKWDEFGETLGWPGFYKVAYKYWDVGFQEVWRSLSKRRFTRSLQELVPNITASDLIAGGSGVRAQACTRTGELVDDFLFVDHGRTIHVINAPSPAATASLAIGEAIVKRCQALFT